MPLVHDIVQVHGTCGVDRSGHLAADVVTTSLSDPSCAPKAEATVCKAYAKGVGGCSAAFPACFGTDDALAAVFCAKP